MPDLVTTCAGYSLQRVGGPCPLRDECRRYRAHVPGAGYPQDDFLCRVGRWEWYAPTSPAAELNELKRFPREVPHE